MLDLLVQHGEIYALSVDGCAFVDGYVCPQPVNSDFLNTEAQEKMISGNLLKAWQVALTRFQSQPGLSSQQTDLKHYKIGFTESEDHYIVLFQGLLLPQVESGEVTGYLTRALGTTTKYWVEKKSFKIEKALFYK